MSIPERMSVGISAHVYPETVIGARVHPEENRVVVTLEASGCGCGWVDVKVFADRAELVRLVDALRATLAELDGKRAMLERGEESAA